MIVLGITLLGLTGAFGSTDWGSAFGANASGERLVRMRSSRHWDGDAFKNPVPTKMSTGSYWDTTVRWLSGDTVREPPVPLVFPPLQPATLASPPATGLRVTWLGHSTAFIELDGKRMLTDPVFSERTSPSRWAGPKRFYAPPLQLNDVPALDAIIISHDHYDHLDHRTIRALQERTGQFVVPLGVGAHLESWGVPKEKIRELDWWESERIDDVELIATPARHFSGRSPFDHNATLWASWTLVGPKHRVFFSGDSGMFGGFEDIGKAYGPFDVTMIESGAYDANWAEIHMGPDNAVDAHLALRGKVMLPIHWGTFNLAIHTWTEPIERIRRKAAERGVTVAQPTPGQPFEPSASVPTAPWW